jgi:hypothetical protein
MLCDDMQYCSNYAHKWIHAQPNVNEESITDWLMYEVSYRNQTVKYRLFTHAQEAICGADWEWWFLYKTGAQRFRAQAKKACKSDLHASLNRSNKNGRQIDHLLSRCVTVNAFPLYAFYSHLNYPSMCPVHSVGYTGAYLAPAESIKSLLQTTNKISPLDVRSKSRPLQ